MKYKSIDPKELEARKNNIDYSPRKTFEHLEYGMSEDDSLEKFIQQRHDHEQQQEEVYRERQNKLRDLNREGSVEAILSPQQYKVFQYTFELNKNTYEIADLMGISHQTVWEYLKTVTRKLQEYYKIDPDNS